jgi:hypothetical protein
MIGLLEPMISVPPYEIQHAAPLKKTCLDQVGTVAQHPGRRFIDEHRRLEQGGLPGSALGEYGDRHNQDQHHE